MAPAITRETWPSFIYDLPWLSIVLVLILVAIAGFGRPNPSDRWPLNSVNVGLYSFRYAENETVPLFYVPIFCLLCVCLIILVEMFFDRTFHWKCRLFIAVNVILTAGEGLGWTIVFTEFIKSWVSELRPDFLYRCLKDPTSIPDDTRTPITCNNDDHLIKDGRQSFPSGHASNSFFIGFFTTAYLIWTVYHRNGEAIHIRASNAVENYSQWRSSLYRQLTLLFTIVLCLPLIVGFFISVSRVYDFRHSPADVSFGCLIGLCAAAVFLFRLFGDLNRLFTNPQVIDVGEQSVMSVVDYHSSNSVTDLDACDV